MTVIARVGDLEVADTLAESDILNVTIPAATIGPDSLLIARIFGRMKNESGGTRAARMACYLGATKVYDTSATEDYASSAAFRPFHIDLLLGMRGTVSSGRLELKFGLGPTAGAAVGEGWMYTSNPNHGPVGADTSVDMSAEIGLRVTITMSVAHASFLFQRRYAIVGVV
jgi:hypothetical protein